MYKRLSPIVIAVLLICVGLCGCSEEKFDISLNIVALKLSDLDEGYIEENVTYDIYNDTELLEYYYSSFHMQTDDDWNGIIQSLHKYKSIKEAKSEYNRIKSYLMIDFIEISINTIGHESFFGDDFKDTYVILFRKGNIVVYLYYGNFYFRLVAMSFAETIEKRIK
jgi:hypothetical protein